MRKLVILIILFLVIISGCQTNSGHHVEIDWVDFLKWDGKMYDNIHSGALANQMYIDKKIGQVKFKVADNIDDPEYKVKNGDSAFHEKGTDIYTIKGAKDFIAVKDSQAINGYSIYFSRDGAKYSWKFKDMPIEKVNKIEIYQNYTPDGTKRLAEIKNTQQIYRLLEMLKTSQESPNFEPNTEDHDPEYYQIVLYTGEPIAYQFDLAFDGQTYFWYPAETAILTNEFQEFIPRN